MKAAADQAPAQRATEAAKTSAASQSAEKTAHDKPTGARTEGTYDHSNLRSLPQLRAGKSTEALSKSDGPSTPGDVARDQILRTQSAHADGLRRHQARSPGDDPGVATRTPPEAKAAAKPGDAGAAHDHVEPPGREALQQPQSAGTDQAAAAARPPDAAAVGRGSDSTGDRAHRASRPEGRTSFDHSNLVALPPLTPHEIAEALRNFQFADRLKDLPQKLDRAGIQVDWDTRERPAQEDPKPADQNAPAVTKPIPASGDRTAPAGGDAAGASGDKSARPDHEKSPARSATNKPGEGGDREQNFRREMVEVKRQWAEAGMLLIDNPTAFENSIAGSVGSGKEYQAIVDPQSADIRGYAHTYGENHLEIFDRNGTKVLYTSTGNRPLESDAWVTDLVADLMTGGQTKLARSVLTMLKTAAQAAVETAAGGAAKAGLKAASGAVAEAIAESGISGGGRSMAEGAAEGVAETAETALRRAAVPGLEKTAGTAAEATAESGAGAAAERTAGTGAEATAEKGAGNAARKLSERLAAGKVRPESGDLPLRPGISRNEFMEQFTDKHYYPDGEPVAFKQPAVDRTTDTVRRAFSEVRNPRTGVLSVEETRSAREWVQYKNVELNSPDRLVVNVKNNVKEAMLKFDDAVTRKGGSTSAWSASGDGSRYRLVLEKPDHLTIHVEVSGFQDLPPDLQESLRHAARDTAEAFSDHGFGQPVKLGGLPVQVDVVPAAPRLPSSGR
jgi:hypothetical protein